MSPRSRTRCPHSAGHELAPGVGQRRVEALLRESSIAAASARSDVSEKSVGTRMCLMANMDDLAWMAHGLMQGVHQAGCLPGTPFSSRESRKRRSSCARVHPLHPPTSTHPTQVRGKDREAATSRSGMRSAALENMSAHPDELSLAASRAEPGGSGVQRRTERAKLAVIVVDDDPFSGDGLARLVRSFGHGCRVASSGDEALRLMGEGHADVVISDWEMPGMSGAELCKSLRAAADDAPYTYFILLTGFDDREHLFGAMEAGADHYQRKPVDLDALEAQLVSAARLVGLHRRLASRASKQ